MILAQASHWTPDLRVKYPVPGSRRGLGLTVVSIGIFALRRGGGWHGSRPSDAIGYNDVGDDRSCSAQADSLRIGPSSISKFIFLIAANSKYFNSLGFFFFFILLISIFVVFSAITNSSSYVLL